MKKGKNEHNTTKVANKHINRYTADKCIGGWNSWFGNKASGIFSSVQMSNSADVHIFVQKQWRRKKGQRWGRRIHDPTVSARWNNAASIITKREVWLGCPEFSRHWPHAICCSSSCCSPPCYYSNWRSELNVTRIVCCRICWCCRRGEEWDISLDCLLMVYLRKYCYVLLIKQNSLLFTVNNNRKPCVFTIQLTLFQCGGEKSLNPPPCSKA